MNTDKLFCDYDRNGEPIYYYDEELKDVFSGHIEDYDRGFKCMEADVVDGYIDGICKVYYFKSDKLEYISWMKHNLQNGLYMDFYENGQVQYVCLVRNNWYYDEHRYDNEGKLIEKTIWSEKTTSFADPVVDPKLIEELRKKYDLDKINEEILRDGINFQYEKYFRK